MNHDHMRYLAPEAIALEGEGLRCLHDPNWHDPPRPMPYTREQVEREILPALRRAYAAMREARG